MPAAGRKLRPPSPGAADGGEEDGAELLQQAAGRNPTLARILQTLQSVALTAVWQVGARFLLAAGAPPARSGRWGQLGSRKQGKQPGEVGQ